MDKIDELCKSWRDEADTHVSATPEAVKQVADAIASRKQIEQHNRDACHKQQRQQERKRLFQEVSVMLYPVWLKSPSDENYRQYLDSQGATITDIILQASEDFAKDKE